MMMMLRHVTTIAIAASTVLLADVVNVANANVMSTTFFKASTTPLSDDSTVTSETTLFVPTWDHFDDAPNDVVCFVGSATNLQSDILSVNGGGGTDCTAENGCGVHVHSGMSCDDKESQGGHWYNPDEIPVDPWLTVGYLRTSSDGYGQYASCVRTGYDSLSTDPDQLAGHVFIIHAEDGSRISCGQIVKASAEDVDPTILTAHTVPIPGVVTDDSTVQPTSFGFTKVMTNIEGSITDGVCYMGFATGMEPNVESFLLDTGSQQCNVTNGCGTHIHAGFGCEDADAQGGHYYDADEIAVDPWLLESYYSTFSTGTTAFVGCAITGNGATDYDSRAFIVHGTDGSRLLCGLLDDPEEDDSSKGDEHSSHDHSALEHHNTMSMSFFTASTKPLSEDSTVTSETTLFVPQWDDFDDVPNDVVCFVGSATNLQNDILSVNGGGGTDCTAENGCGVHVHSGTSCDDKETQGGHWYNSDEVPVDPWLAVGYLQTSSDGYGQYASCVRTGYDSLSTDPDQLAGHVFIIHAEDGSRISCGQIMKASAGDVDPTILTAHTVPIPGVVTDLSFFDGLTNVVTNIEGSIADGVCYMGFASGMEPNVESFLLDTGSEQCNVTNGCGTHIHAGFGCEDADAQGGHYYDADEIAVDPWLLESYFATSSTGTTVFVGCAITGNGATDYDSRAFIVHGTDGSRLLCGLLEKHSSDDEMEIAEGSSDHSSHDHSSHDHAASTDPTIQQSLCDNPDFTIFCILMDACDADLDGPVTVFAPNDVAFASLFQALGGLDAIRDADILCDTLSFHIVPGQELHSDDLNCSDKIEMSNGVNARVKCTKGSPSGIKGGGNVETANFIDVDIHADDGAVIHTIDGVLLYPNMLKDPAISSSLRGMELP